MSRNPHSKSKWESQDSGGDWGSRAKVNDRCYAWKEAEKLVEKPFAESQWHITRKNNCYSLRLLEGAALDSWANHEQTVNPCLGLQM